MIYETYIPPPPLSIYVENIIFYEGYFPEQSVQKLLPDGCIHIIIDMEENGKKLFNNDDFSKYTIYKDSFISGQHNGFLHIETTQNSSMMVLRFNLGGAFPFFNFPISQLNDDVQQLEKFWGDEINQLRKKIIAEKDISKKFHIMESFLLEKIKNGVQENNVLTTAIKELTNNPYKFTTKEVAKTTGISQKHLISLFDKYIGLTPKALSRIFRFQKVLLQIEQHKKIEWLQITYDCGYYDQAHFIKDFCNFSGINPSEYLTQKGEYLNYIPVK
jgi:AraC-like DNA-binding protein